MKPEALRRLAAVLAGVLALVVIAALLRTVPEATEVATQDLNTGFDSGRMVRLDAGPREPKTVVTVPAVDCDDPGLKEQCPAPLTGDLVVTCRDGEGLPVSGVMVQILPPLTFGPPPGREWHAIYVERVFPRHRPPDGSDSGPDRLSWRRVTEVDGLAHWDSLPAGSGYRWGIVDGRPGCIEPKHESAGIQEIGGGIRFSDPAPHDLSGPFEIPAGKVTRFSFVTDVPGVVQGRISRSPVTRLYSSVILFKKEIHVRADGRVGLQRNVEEARVLPAIDGTFRFSGVAPGSKIVQAFWESAEDEYVFALRGFDVPKGESVDLGILLPRTTEVSFTAEVRVKNSSGQYLAGADLLLDPAVAVALCHLSVRSRSGDPLEFIMEMLPVRLDRRFRVSGLAPGEVLLAADWHPESDRVLRSPGLHKRGTEDVQVNVPTLQPSVLTLGLGDARKTRLEFLPPPGQCPGPLKVFIRGPRDHQRTFKVDAPPRGNSTTMADFILESGRHVLFATGGGEAGGDDVAQEITFDVGDHDDQVVQIALQPAAWLDGRCVTPERAPCPARALRWSFGGWAEIASPVWVYETTTDAEGRFRIGGILPGHRLLSPERDAGIDVAFPRRVDIEVVIGADR